MAFIAMCEGYLGIERHFELWRYFFSISLIKKKERGMSVFWTGGSSTNE